MTPDRYLDVLTTDGARLARTARAAGLDDPIPSCPGWTVRECVWHTGQVFFNKARWLGIGRRPQAGEYESEPPAGAGLVDWYERALATIVDALRSRDPEAAADSWWPRDQTVGFWYRRMAQEVAVHRVDVEDAHGAPTPIPDDVAVDGIDEVLHVFLEEDWPSLTAEDWDGVDPAAGAGATVVVRAGGRAWATTLGPDAMPTTDIPSGAGGAAAATVSGDPENVLLWLWGRRPDEAVGLDGDRDALDAFRARLVLATR
jgi:uncharacterized protein (TIGR03083 family)